MPSVLFEQSWPRAALLVVTGALQTLTFSPFNGWWLGPVSVFLILLCCLPLASEKLFRAGWLTGLGLFGSGASWVYVSLHDYGGMPMLLAALSTLIFNAIYAVCPAVAGAIFHVVNQIRRFV